MISPYFNRSQLLVNWFDLLCKIIHSGKADKWTKEKLWSKIYKGEAFDDVRYRKLNSDLLKLVEGFLAQSEYEDNQVNQANYLLEAIKKRKMEKLYSSSKRQAERALEVEGVWNKSASYYFHQYQFQKSYYDLDKSNLQRTSKSNIENIVDNLDYFYLAEKLKYYYEMKSRQSVATQHNYQISLIDEIANHIGDATYDEIPAVAIYYQVYLTQKDPSDVDHYFKLKDLLGKHGNEFPANEAKEIYTTAINYCINKINKGKQQFLGEFIDINEDYLRKDILIEGELSPWKFQNIVTAACRLGRYEWTKEFISKYKEKLPTNYRDNAVSYNIARLYFYQKNYSKVVEMLREVEYEDFSYNLGSKSMLIPTYYELDELEPLYSLLDSFRTYLSRHKEEMPLQRYNNYVNLIGFTRKLIKIIPGDQKAIGKLKGEIDNSSGIMNEEWLRQKIAELE
ncbi:MAG: hypothetical protein AAFV95_15285 [Bacteroidota bacterium]